MLSTDSFRQLLKTQLFSEYLPSTYSALEVSQSHYMCYINSLTYSMFYEIKLDTIINTTTVVSY